MPFGEQAADVLPDANTHALERLRSNRPLLEALKVCFERFVARLALERLRGAQLCGVLQEAYWFYLDELLPEARSELPKMNKSTFFTLMLDSSTALSSMYASPEEREQLLNDWRDHLHSVPRRGAILVDARLEKCLMVKTFSKGGLWTHPCGKMDEGDESDAACAAREVLEETGVDIRGLIDERDCVKALFKEREESTDAISVKLFLVAGIPLDVECRPNLPQEIAKIGWIALDRLPGYDVTGAAAEASKLRFYNVEWSVPKLRKWVEKRRRADLEGSSPPCSGTAARGGCGGGGGPSSSQPPRLAPTPPAPRGVEGESGALPRPRTQPACSLASSAAPAPAPAAAPAAPRAACSLAPPVDWLNLRRVMCEFDRGWEVLPMVREIQSQPVFWEVAFETDALDALRSLWSERRADLLGDACKVLHVARDLHVTLLYIGGGLAKSYPHLGAGDMARFSETLARSEGRTVDVHVVSLVSNGRIAAAEVLLGGGGGAAGTEKLCANARPHITLACAAGVAPAGSNAMLATLATRAPAKRMPLAQPLRLQGRVHARSAGELAELAREARYQ